MPTLQELDLRASLARRDARILELEKQLEQQTFRADKFEGALKAMQTSAAHIDRLKIANERIQELERQNLDVARSTHELMRERDKFRRGMVVAEKQRDALAEALAGLHLVCELALAGPDGQQHAYFATHDGCFVASTGAMTAAEAALAGVKKGGGWRVDLDGEKPA